MRTNRRHSSDRPDGLFVSIDGPSGAGKTTIVHHLAQLLAAEGQSVHVTAEPSSGPIGDLCRALTETVTGEALACLYAADRYHHLATEIQPNLMAGHLVICDRCLPSGLVVQRLDGVHAGFLWNINEAADLPDLAMILEGDPKVISERLAERGPYNRFRTMPDSSHVEVHFYHEAAEHMSEAGFNVLRMDCGKRPSHEIAAAIRDRLLTLVTTGRSDGRSRSSTRRCPTGQGRRGGRCRTLSGSRRRTGQPSAGRRG